MRIPHTTTRIFIAFFVFAAAISGCASTQKREGTGEYFDDSIVTTKVKAAILADRSLKVMQINVETYKGIVQLSGFVDTEAAVSKAAEVAGAVSGVRSVSNDLIAR